MHTYRHLLLIFSSCCLIFLLSACSPFPSGGTSPTPTTGGGTTISSQGNTPTAASGTPTTVPVPPTQTSCPAAGTARAAVTATLALGNHVNLVYTFNQGTADNPTSAILRRYDVRTNGKTDIVTLPRTYIDTAQISTDGQWILFTSTTSGQDVIQMVRMDGQGLQTLHCAPASQHISDVQWSPDQKSAIFVEGQDLSSSTVYLLTLASGTLQPEIAPPSPGSIGVTPQTWLDNTHVYMTGFVANSDAPPQNVYLLDTGKGAHQQVSNLQQVVKVSGFCFSFDSSIDNKNLFLSQCNSSLSSPGGGIALQSPSSISTQPATGGGSQKSIFSNSTLAVTTLRVISSTTMLLIIGNTSGNTSHNGLYKIHTDGSGLTPLTTNGSGQTSSLNPFTQYTWSNLSRDGSTYALKLTSNQGANQALLIGSLSGGSPSTIASFNGTGNVNVVGWTFV